MQGLIVYTVPRVCDYNLLSDGTFFLSKSEYFNDMITHHVSLGPSFSI